MLTRCVAQRGAAHLLRISGVASGVAWLSTSSKFKGVSWDERRQQWKASLVQDGNEIVTGHFGDEEAAARSYDMIARIMLGSGASTNFDLDMPKLRKQQTAKHEGAGLRNATIEVRVGELLDVEEMVTAVEEDGGRDVVVMDLSGKSDLGDYICIATGRAAPHCRRLATLMTKAMRAREIPSYDALAARVDLQGGDWISVDTGTVVWHFLTQEKRDELDLEAHIDSLSLASMPHDRFIEKGYTPEEILDAVPSPGDGPYDVHLDVR